MQLLFANKFLWPKGGSETHLFGLAAALEARGHVTEFFGTDDPRNVTPPDRTTTVPGTDYNDVRGVFAKASAFGGMIYSRAAARAVRDRLQRPDRQRPDVAHLHNIYHQLSPSVLVALRRAGIPCVLTAHDYKLVCPSYSLHDGRAECFACRDHRYWHLLTRGCSRKGFAGSIALATEAYLHRWMRIYERHLNLIIAPSRFLRDRLVEGGFDPARIRVLPNAIRIEDYAPSPTPGDYLLYVGRLSYEKGLPTLIAAAAAFTDVPLWLAGDGPLRAELEQQAAGLTHVRFLGVQSHEEVRRLLRGCRALVLASGVPENCPLSVLEAFATAKPVVATRVGGVPELFEHGTTGLTVPPGDAVALGDAMRRAWNDPDFCEHAGRTARELVEQRHDLNRYVDEIEAIYAEVRASRKGVGSLFRVDEDTRGVSPTALAADPKKTPDPVTKPEESVACASR